MRKEEKPIEERTSPGQNQKPIFQATKKDRVKMLAGLRDTRNNQPIATSEKAVCDKEGICRVFLALLILILPFFTQAQNCTLDYSKAAQLFNSGSASFMPSLKKNDTVSSSYSYSFSSQGMMLTYRSKSGNKITTPIEFGAQGVATISNSFQNIFEFVIYGSNKKSFLFINGENIIPHVEDQYFRVKISKNLLIINFINEKDNSTTHYGVYDLDEDTFCIYKPDLSTTAK